MVISSPSGIHLDDYARAAIDYLPPYYDAATRDIWRVFLQNWGTSYTVTSTNGAMVEMTVAADHNLWHWFRVTNICTSMHDVWNVMTQTNMH